MELSNIEDSFERVAKKQKLSSSKSKEIIDQVICEIEQALASMRSDHDPTIYVDQKSILTELKTKLAVIGPIGHSEGSQRELNISLSKHVKVLEQTWNPDISKAYRNVDFDTHIVNQIIINHFCRESEFGIVDCLINEASEPDGVLSRLQFQEMDEILEAMKSRNVEPAFTWVSTNRARLDKSVSNLELKLHKLRFVEILQNGTREDAISYAKTCLSPLASRHMNEIQKLMSSILWAGKLDRSPYSDLIDPTRWEKLSKELFQQFCNFMGQSSQNSLRVVVAAAVEGLPTLLKLAKVMAAKPDEWLAMKQLPVPIELGKEFQFHSIFVCPVSRDQGSEDNPPMLLPCGHVLCMQSIVKLSKSYTRNFKCPYCPVYTLGGLGARCKRLYF
ncbi:protein RMD5 homolog [Olea europaea var. sylvestris]|uniref:protein RMD5 homolog n=1 Tax=Olea europaea var. sylvestris TaxID=158386 RepID=UPI000C1CDA22|nr:protein RMD5 homolog [Olea europaea var. sylvestris]XP_022896192.1 protein RMD5 homolog [Olea europaea var. sylvestris]